jgi:hypothetical protein
MSNKKPWPKAQEGVPGNPPKGGRTGYLNIESVSESLKKSQTRPCDPFKTILQITKNLKVSPTALYFKVLRYDVRGNVTLRVAKSQSSGSSGTNEYITLINILSERVMKVIPINKTSNRDGKPKKVPKGNRPKRSTGGSYRSRKTDRRSKRRDLYRRRAAIADDLRGPDQVLVKENDTISMVQPTDFNTPGQNLPKKDFASIFESANNKLYSDEPDEVIEIESPPGVAKYVSLGVDVDRPSVLSSTELSKIIYDDSLDVFDQMVLERELRLQAIFNNLESIDEYDITKLLETQATIEALTSNAIDSVSKIAKVDEEIINDISIAMFDLASSLGFKNTELLTRIYIQAAFDLGAVSEVGPFDPPAGAPRELASSGNSINIDLNRSYGSFNIDYIKSGLQMKPITETANYDIGKTGNLLSFQSTINPVEFSGADWAADRPTLGNRINSEDTAILMQLVYTELVLSKLYTSGDANVIALKDKGTINIAEMFLGDLSSASVDLNSVDVPTGLASIVKYNSGGVNYYPLESDVSNASGLSGRTFLDAVVQPAIGSLIEDKDPDFALLDAWVENSRANLSTFFKYSDALYDTGGSAIVLNEILLALVDFLIDPNKKIGSKSHPFSNSMSRAHGLLDKNQLVLILKYFFKNAGYSGKSSILYNTFGHCTHPENIDIADYLNTGAGGFGYLSTKTKASIIGGERFSIASDDQIIKISNNFFEEASRFCNLLENGLMNSIDIMLSNAGMIKTTSDLDYGSISQGFFVDKSVIGKESFPAGGAAQTSPVSPHQSTAFSGIPKIAIRKILANLCFNVFRISIGTSGTYPALDNLLDDENKGLLKLSKLAVENLDPSLGPVRWKVTHGQWPPESGDFSDITDDTFVKLVPSHIQEALENGSPEVSVDSEGSVEVTDPLDGWEFLESKEGYCPITLILDGEDNSQDSVSFAKANRNLADSVMQQIVGLRSACFKMRHLLEAPVAAFETFPDTIEQVASTLSFDSIKELAQLPSIDGQEIVKFTSPIQISSARKSLMLETPSPSLRYLPNKYAISKDAYAVARSIISNYVENYFERPDKALIHSLAIPAGYLSSENLVNEQFSLTRNASYMFFPSEKFEPKETIYHSSVYLIPGSFSNCDSEASFDSNVLNAKFYIAAEGIYRLMDYSDALEYIGSNDAEIILRNHVIDYALYLILKITTGIEFSEDTFRLNKLANERYISSDSAKEIPNLMKKFPNAYKDIIKEDKVADFRDAVKIFDDMTIPEINLYMGSMDCRLLSPEMIAKQALSPRVFDRVFNMLTHPNDHYIEAETQSAERRSSLEWASFTINGKSKTGYRIALKDGSSNSIRNDHFAEYNFMVEK